MFYYLYEIRNNLNGKIYVGVHKTKSMDDGYMGSGKILRRAIEKNGIENFTKTVLEEFETAKEMFAREKEVVTDEFLLREDVYNLRRGGTGGFDYLNKTEKNVWFKDKSPFLDPRIGQKGNDALAALRRCPEYNTWFMKTRRPGITKDIQSQGTKSAQSKQAREKRKETFEQINHQQGEKNSQFGSMWITNETENKKIKKTDPIPEGWRKGRKIIYPLKLI